MLKKKKIVIPGLIIVFLIGTAAAIIYFFDLNKLKPVINRTVKHYTGRELTINGDIRLQALWPPTLMAEDVAFQNAPWGSQPHMVRVKRASFAVSLKPILRGEFRFFQIRLEEPEVLLEFNQEGISNFLLDTPESKGDAVVPALAFNDIFIQNGYFEYNDERGDLKASVIVDKLKADIPGLDKPVQILFEGSFRGLPCSMDGSIGPIIAWIQPGYILPVDLSARLGGASARLAGDIRDPSQLKDISLVFTTNGPSTHEMAKTIKWASFPDLGAFSLKAVLTDRPGQLAIDQLAVKIGSPDQVAFSATGRIDNLIEMQGFDLDLSMQTRHTGNLRRLAGLPASPLKAPLSARVTFTDSAENQFRLDDFLVTIDDQAIQGHMNLDLTQRPPVLDMHLKSQHTPLGSFALQTRVSRSPGRVSVEHLAFQMGHDDLFKASLVGTVGNLTPLEDLKLNFHIIGKDLARLQQLTDRPLPLQGPYAVSGTLIMADRKAIQVPKLKIILDKNSINGSLRLDSAHDAPMLYGDFTSHRLNLERLLTPETLPDKLRKNLASIGPSRLIFEVSSPIQRPVLKHIELQSRVDTLASLHLKGSVNNLLAMTGTDLHMAIKGSDLADLKRIVGRDIPFNGPYAFSGRLRNTAGDTYHLEAVKITAAKNTFSGQSVIHLAKPNTRVSVQVGAENISLEALAEGQNPVLERLRTQKDLGPLEIEVTTVFSHKDYRLQSLDLAFGKDDFVRTRVEGSIGSLAELQDIQLDFQISGQNVSNLELIAGRAIPVKGPYSLSGEFSGQAPGNIMLRNLDLILEGNRFAGQADLDMAGEFPTIEAKISADHFSLAPVTLKKVDPLKHITDLGPLKLTFTLSEKNGTPALTQLDIRLGKESALAAMLRGTVGSLNPIGEVSLDFEIHSQDLSILNNAYGSRLIRGVPFQIMGRLDAPQPNKITVTALEALYSDSDLSGTASLDFTGDRPSLVARLSSRRLDLRPFIETPDQGGPPPQTPASSKKPGKSVLTRAHLDPRPFIEEPERGEPPSQAPALSKNPDKRVFSREHFDLTPLQQITADVTFQGEEVLAKRLAVNDVGIRLKLRKGNLDVDPLKFRIGGGTAEGTFALQSRNNPPYMAASLAVHQFDIGPMLQQLEQDDILQGTLNTSIYLNSKGNSVAALMAGLNGKVQLNIHDGQIESKQLAFLERYMGSNVMELINPFIKRPTHTAINCLITSVEIKAGQADCKMVLDTEQSALISTGNIDLKTERLNIGIKPTPKKGFGEQHVGYISFSLKELSQPFGLGGTLARPQLVLDPGRTVITAAKFAGAFALGPVGMALFFSDISVGKKNICEEASMATGK